MNNNKNNIQENNQTNQDNNPSTNNYLLPNDVFLTEQNNTPIRENDIFLKKKIEFMKNLYEKHGDYEITTCLNGVWQKWKKYSACSEEEIRNANLRSVLNCEIVLDVDMPEKLDEILKKLDKENLSYTLWDTGSRGYHISLFFEELNDYNEIKRTKIKEAFILNHFSDPAKKSGRNLIALEYSLHFKGTGKIKTLLKEEIRGKNKLSDEYKNIVTDEKMEENNKLNKELTEKLKEYKINEEILEKDQILNYVLNNVIPDGFQRNNILLKNLAIAFYQAGMNEDDVRDIGRRIIANMPGKNINELLGWYKKAQAGILSGYNILELNKWIVDHNLNIPLYKTIEDEELEKKIEKIKTEELNLELLETLDQTGEINCPLYDDFKSFMEDYSWNNQNLSIMLFHTLVGCILRKFDRGIRIGRQYPDARIHSICIQNVGSGKTQAADALQALVEKINATYKFLETSIEIQKNQKSIKDSIDEIQMPPLIVCEQRTKITSDASLTGTFSEKRKKGSAEREFIPGDLQTADILIVTEATSIFNVYKKFDKNVGDIITTLLQATDNTGLITKKLGTTGCIRFKSDCSLVLLSRDTSEFQDPEILLLSGLAARSLLHIRELNEKEIENNAKKVIENINKITVDEKKLDIITMKMYDFIKFVRNYDIFDFDDESKTLLDACVKYLFNRSKNISSEIKKIYYSFIPRYTSKLLTLSLHYAYLRRDKNNLKIIREDVLNAMKVILMTIDSIEEFIEENIKLQEISQKKESSRIRNEIAFISAWKKSFPSNPFLKPSELYTVLAKEMGKSKAMIKKYCEMFVDRIEDNGEVPNSPRRMIRLKEKYFSKG